MIQLTIRPPVIQLAIDLFTIDEALRLAEIGVAAGVDWLEAGTPLIVRAAQVRLARLQSGSPNMWSWRITRRWTAADATFSSPPSRAGR